MSILSIISEISESVQDGNPLTPDQYEVLAESSESETISAVGEEAAAAIEAAYNVYVANHAD